MVSDWIFDRMYADKNNNKSVYTTQEFYDYVSEWCDRGWCFKNIKEAIESGNDNLVRYSLLSYFCLVAPEWKSKELFDYIFSVNWVNIQ